jgi:class 3 adenylate cyclase/tetratricopeptide (TPR) repeat protein
MPASSPALPATFAEGRYEVKGFLGEGGRKKVYLAHDSKLDRDVAVAVIKTEGLDDAGLARVKREAQAMGRLGDHPNIVTVFDIGDDGAQPYIVSQYMGGGDLDGLLGAATNRQMAAEDAIRIAEQICDGLDHAHSRGIVHRDLKPGNIWLTNEGTAKIGDFGLAVALDRSRLTLQGMMVGTVGYMPPEQALGRAADARSDLYSLGCILYEMVTGRPPFLGEDAVAVISQHINTAPVAPSYQNQSVPRGLESLIITLLAKPPAERPQSAGAVAAELRRIGDSASQMASVEQAPSPLAGPGGLGGVTWGAFVGRRQEMDQLKTALEDCLSSRGTLAMLIGEPGIGKTRLAQEFTVYAELRGARVISGRCYEGEGTVPYLPFVESFRQYVRGREDPALREELGPGAPEVAELVSEIRQRFPDVATPPQLEGDAARHRLFDSVSTFVANASGANPLVIFLDDIHWADKPTLLLMQHLARSVANLRVLILGAYRDIELDRTHPLAEVIAALRREQPYRRVLLRGLPEDDIMSYLEAASAQATNEGNEAGRRALSAVLYRETEGNPFFIREIITHLVEEGKLYRDENGSWTAGNISDVSELGIPEGVREVIGRRLSLLGEGCNRMLTLASTMTGGFTWEALKAMALTPDLSEEGLLSLLEEALGAQLLSERRDASGTYDFTHALIRQTLYEELSTPRRVLLHRQIGEALERLYEGNVEPHLPELAHHFFQAAPGGDVEKAIDYARRAGDRAMAQYAYEDATGHYERALQAMELKSPVDEGTRSALLICLAGAQITAGEPTKARETGEKAVRTARGLNDGELLGRATLSVADALFHSFGTAHEFEECILLIEEALAAIGTSDSTTRALLLNRMARALSFARGLDTEDNLPFAREAVAMAERIGDAALSAVAIDSLRGAMWRPEFIDERLAACTEAVRLAKSAGDQNAEFSGRSWRTIDLLELGDIAGVDAEIGAMADLAATLRRPLYSYRVQSFQATRAGMKGRLAEAEGLIMECLALAQKAGYDATLDFGAQISNVRWLQGRYSELIEPFRQIIERYPTVSASRAGLAFFLKELDNREEAAVEFEQLATHDFDDLPRDALWLVATTIAVETCCYLRDLPRAQMLYDMLLPYAGRLVVVGSGLNCYGSVSRYLGMAASVLGRAEDATRHFEEAIESDTRAGATPWIAFSRLQYADFLLAQGDANSRENALPMLGAALDTFEQLGMTGLLERALALKMKAQGIDLSDIGTSIDTVAHEALAERPDLKPHAAPDGTVTIMFSDIEGSTAMADRLGDTRFMEVLREHNTIIREQIKGNAGFEVKSEGDGFMVAFQSAGKALACAESIQKALVTRNESAEEPVLVRVGLHAGEVIKEGEDFFGRNVIMAARVASQAHGGEILASGILKGLVEGSDVAWGEMRTVALKGLSGEHEIWAVEWRTANVPSDTGTNDTKKS